MAKRMIIIDDQVFHYTVGQMYVRVTRPDNRSTAVPLTDVTGLSWTEIERGHYKHTLKVTPGNIEGIIRARFLNAAHQE